MKLSTIAPFIPIYLAFVPLFKYVWKHEKERVKDCLLLKQVCRKLNIETGD